jgi:hypothetical protein
MFMCCSIDTDNPELPELALALAPVTIRVLTSFDNCLLGNPESSTACAVITFREFQDLFATRS